MHLLEKNKLLRAAEHLDKSIEFMTGVMDLNRGIREVQQVANELLALGIIADD